MGVWISCEPPVNGRLIHDGLLQQAKTAKLHCRVSHMIHQPFVSERSDMKPHVLVLVRYSSANGPMSSNRQRVSDVAGRQNRPDRRPTRPPVTIGDSLCVAYQRSHPYHTSHSNHTLRISIKWPTVSLATLHTLLHSLHPDSDRHAAGANTAEPPPPVGGVYVSCPALTISQHRLTWANRITSFIQSDHRNSNQPYPSLAIHGARLHALAAKQDSPHPASRSCSDCFQGLYTSSARTVQWE